MTNIIDVLEKTTANSLILFDELGSGTDPAEGMGIATAILEELLAKSCLFTVTTHYTRETKHFPGNPYYVIQ
jgi:dsDNA-specific endonuclease/ATPase MutS2